MFRISVIITTYNREKLVKEAVESVLQQTLKDLEILIVDDGSTDNTRNVIGKIEDSRVKYFYKINGGLSSARNFGLRKARGEYIIFCDSDDLWPSQYFEIMLNHLEKTKKYGAAYSKTKLLLSDGKLEKFGKQNRNESGWITNNFFGGGQCVLESGTVFRSSVLSQFWWDEGLKNHIGHDGLLRLTLRAKFVFVPETYFIRRHVPDSVSRIAKNEISLNGPLVMERFYYKLGGNKYIPKFTAMRKISHRYRRMAKLHRAAKNRQASITLTKRAIRYYPLDIRLYFDLLKALLLSKKKDPNPAWKMPKPLPLHITVSCGTKNKECKSFVKQ